VVVDFVALLTSLLHAYRGHVSVHDGHFGPICSRVISDSFIP
jgi:hypothetical protein